VRILKRVKGVLGLPTYRVEVLEILKKSSCTARRCGSKLTVAAIDLAGDIRLFPEEEVAAADGN